MGKRLFLLFVFAFSTVTVFFSCSQETQKTTLAPEETINQFLGRTYGKLDETHNARIVRASSSCIGTPEGEIDCEPFRDQSDDYNSDYYMKLQRIDRVGDQNAPTDEKYYVLVTGNGASCYACTGMFGVFVFEWRDGQLEVTASAPHIIHGSSGEPAASWELVQLNNADYRGWIARHAGDGRAGYQFKWAEIHAPHDGKIVPLFELTTAYYYSGPWYQNRPEGKQFPMETDLKMDVHLDTAAENAKVYPLKITVSGTVKGKRLEPKTFIIPFDEKEWKYKPSREFEAYAKLMEI